ncbi:hypothetical protein J7400_18900 [Shimia sp. R9_2]|uniref:hypothetical protein n=1 Tax=Shimia sp. R9_2 TaxID=2821112 RepID=UPI001AD9CD55|nr:hypothetical protein [Shimia sp. R9_2]MBO9398746.1 hypothetical protein [Shimia sp. R9_2]
MVSNRQVREQLKKGGQRVFSSAKAEIYDKQGARLDRQTAAGIDTNVHQLLDPRLPLTDAQRAVGNCFGAYTQELLAGGRGSNILRERVDSTPTGAAGVSEGLVYRSQMVACAVKVLQAAPKITYKVGTARNCVMGNHKPISCLELASKVCTQQRTLSQVAITFGWVRIPVKDGQWQSPKVPDRQRKHLSQALADTIDMISDAWEEGGYKVPHQFFTVVVR